MADNYDAIIASTGLVGGQAAQSLAAQGYGACALKTKSGDELPSKSNKSTAGTSPSAMVSFNIPGEIVMNLIDDVVLESSGGHHHHHQSGAVLESADFKNRLVDEAEADGVKYRFGTRVPRPIMEGGEAANARYNGDEEMCVDIIIGATGPNTLLVKALGLCDLRREKQVISIEYESEDTDPVPDGYGDLTGAMMLRLDHDIMLDGYLWISHIGGDTTKVGACYTRNEGRHHNAKSSYAIDDYFQYWTESNPHFTDAECIADKQHRGSACIQLPGRMDTDNFMVIGDTVLTIDPSWGEGIDKYMRSDKTAATTADRVPINSKRNTSVLELAIYGQLWHDRAAPRVENRLFMMEVLYRASSERYDKLLEDLHRPPDGQLNAVNGGSLLTMLRMLKFEDPFTLVSIAKDWLSN